MTMFPSISPPSSNFSPTTAIPYQKCTNCMGNDIISDTCTGDIVCRTCGTVFGEHFVSDEPEWREYENREMDSSRSSMGKVAEEEMEHRIFTGGNKEECDHLNRIQNYGYSKKDIKIFDSYNQIEQLTFKLGLSDIVTDRAKDIFKKAYLAKLGSRESLVGGIVYYACLMENSARTMGEISALSGVPVKKINRIYQLVIKDPTLTATTGSQCKVAPTVGYVQLLPGDLIGRMASQLKFPQNLITVARDTCQRIVQCDLMNGHSPQVVAAGVLALLYVATKQQWKMTDLIKVSFTSELSIKKIYQHLQQDCLSILPREFITSIGGISHLPLHLPEC